MQGLIGYEEFPAQRSSRQPLLDFILADLKASRCQILFHTEADRIPFRITFETPYGERMGVVVYPAYANRKETKNRPADEWRFQLKYGQKPRGEPRIVNLWQDPADLYTTLLCGISPETGFFVGLDPVLYNPTKLFISIEFKQADVEEILSKGWHTWERENRGPQRDADVTDGDVFGIQAMVGGTRGSFLRYVRFERESRGEAPGHRMLLAERYSQREVNDLLLPPGVATGSSKDATDPEHIHALAEEFQMSPEEVLDLVSQARRLKMAVRGWVAEHHLYKILSETDGVEECRMLDEEGAPDIELRYRGSRPITVECKNVSRDRYADGSPKVDFQRTRAAKGDPCSRYYTAADFDILAASLHAVEERWVFRYIRPADLDPHDKCPGRLSNRVRVNERWTDDPEEILRTFVEE